MQQRNFTKSDLNLFINTYFRFRSHFIKAYANTTGHKLAPGYVSAMCSGKKGISGITGSALKLFAERHICRVEKIKLMLLENMSVWQVENSTHAISELIAKGLSDNEIYTEIV